MTRIAATRTLGLAVLMAAGLGGAPGAQAASQIIDIDAINDVGTTVALGAGTYTVTFIGTAQGGAYNAWNPWSLVSGCNGSGGNCSNGWLLSLAIDFGFGGTNFNHVDGYQYGQLEVPGDNHIYSTDLAALAQIQTASLVRAPLPTATITGTYLPTPNPISFTLAAGQSVNFFIFDYPYPDNSGGVSIRLDDGVTAPPGAVPEPASWAMMIAGFALSGAAMRRRRHVPGFA